VSNLPAGLTPAQIRAMPFEQQKEVLYFLDELEKKERIEKARQSMTGFTHHMWPAFIEGRHHKIMDKAFDRVIDGSLKRLIINMGPRHTKSEKASFLLPAKYLGQYPDRKVIQTSHTAELAVGFGRRVRNLVGTREYQAVFPDLLLAADSKAAGRWTTSKGGEYYAIGVGGAIAGKGADLFIIDDPHSEQDLMSGDPTVFDRVHEWYTSGPRQRLQPGAAICIVMTRWAKNDLTGKMIREMTSGKGRDQWELIEFPAIFTDEKTGDERALWPEFWTLEELQATRASIPVSKWNAQYLQNPTSEEGALIKREWWNIWEEDEPPDVDYIIQAWDTAYLKTQRSDKSACTTWGVFYRDNADGEPIANIILMDAYNERVEFPELKKKALELYNQREPDTLIIEGKASGWPLIFELRQLGIPVVDYTPVRGSKANPNDKIARVNSVSAIFEAGMVWRPDRRWAENVSEQCAEFPNGDFDDLVDTMTIAMMRFRQGGFIKLPSDYEEEQMPYRKSYSPY
jgi:predicted phage terminase large subunit-like protein